jgi:hypothetical protein
MVAYTHAVNPSTGWAYVQTSVWVGLPVGREVLIGACMASRGTSADEVRVMSDDQVRVWVLGEVLYEGVTRAHGELESVAYQDGYPRSESDREFLALVTDRIDQAFGFAQSEPPTVVQPPSGRPTPARGMPVLTTA